MAKSAPPAMKILYSRTERTPPMNHSSVQSAALVKWSCEVSFDTQARCTVAPRHLPERLVLLHATARRLRRPSSSSAAMFLLRPQISVCVLSGGPRELIGLSEGAHAGRVQPDSNSAFTVKKKKKVWRTGLMLAATVEHIGHRRTVHDREWSKLRAR